MKQKGKAFKKALKTGDMYRFENVPLISDKTELITPEMAEKILKENKKNRPINFNKVRQYRKLMENGEWKFHAQGIIIDNNNNLLTGQKRLWAIIYSGIPQYMRISRGSPADTANFLDRGTPQSARDLASRETDRKHSPIEAGIIRAMCALNGNLRPSIEDISLGLIKYDLRLQLIIEQTRGVKKDQAMKMILGVMCLENKTTQIGEIKGLSEKLIDVLKPMEIEDCWNKGAAFTLAMKAAKKIINENK